MRMHIPAIAVVAMLLLGCIGGGTQTTPTPEPTVGPTAEPTQPPNETPTPVPTPTPTPEGELVPLPTPTGLPPVVEVSDWNDLFGCARTGLSYTYRVTTADGTMDIGYATTSGGTVEGTNTVLKTYTMESAGMQIITREWDSSSSCRCVKTESVIGGQTVPGTCPAAGQGAGEAEGAQTTILPEGIETVNVPAYSGLATKYTVTSTSAAGTYSASVWTAAGISVPVKIVSSGVTTELVTYSG